MCKCFALIGSRGTGAGVGRLAMSFLVLLLGLTLSACTHGGSGGQAPGGTVPGSDGGGSDPAPTPGDPPAPGPSEAPVAFSWSAPALSEDGSALTDLAGYKVYDGSTTSTYGMVTDVGRVTSFTTAPMTEGTYYFAVTAYDTKGNESDFSNEVVVTIGQDDDVQVLASR